MIANIIFGFILVCFIWGVIQNGVENLLSYVLEIALTALVGAFLGWLIGLWYIGAIAGAVYCIYCWIFGKAEKRKTVVSPQGNSGFFCV